MPDVSVLLQFLKEKMKTTPVTLSSNANSDAKNDSPHHLKKHKNPGPLVVSHTLRFNTGITGPLVVSHTLRFNTGITGPLVVSHTLRFNTGINRSPSCFSYSKI